MVTEPCRGRLGRLGRGAAVRRASSTIAWMSRQAGVLTHGAGPARHSLIPLYLAGLWDAVSMAPGASRLPAA